MDITVCHAGASAQSYNDLQRSATSYNELQRSTTTYKRQEAPENEDGGYDKECVSQTRGGHLSSYRAEPSRIEAILVKGMIEKLDPRWQSETPFQD